MAKPGQKPKSIHLKSVQNTARRDRSAEPVFNESQDEPCLPADFEDLMQSKPLVAKRVLRLWNGYLHKFNRRGQNVADFENALYSLCMLEVRIRMLEETGNEVPQAMVNGHRIYLSEFHLTPAGNINTVGKPNGNRFGNNGKPKKS